jgi:LPPG:FO 2-phospho-L-lactate transferase
VSPLIGGKALKGPAAEVLRSLGLPDANRGVAAAYQGIVDSIVIDRSDASDAASLAVPSVIVEDTLITDKDAAVRLGRAILGA